MSEKQVQLINLPKILDPRGNLTFLQYSDQVPFEINRVFWIYDIPGGKVRGGHAYKKQCELIIAMSGSFDVVVNDGKQEQRFHLNRSYTGLYIPAKVWRHMENFSTNSLSLHLSDSAYDAEDYLWDKNNFLKE